MGIKAEELRASLDALAQREPTFAAAIAHAGYPEPRQSAPGYTTLLRTIVGQQVSIKAAASMWNKLQALVGDTSPANLLAASTSSARLLA